jgi:Amt family ammonium transporter
LVEDAGPTVLSTKIAIISAGSLALLWPLAQRRTPSPVMVGCGALSGLVAISGACAYVSSAAAAIIGGVAGIVFMLSVSLLERQSIGVDSGAISVFGASGIWGLLAVGCFSNGTGGHGFNGVVRDAYVANYGTDGVRDLFYGDPSQFVAQLLGAGVVTIVGFGLAFAFFKVSNWFVPVRVASDVEPAVPRAAGASGQQPL